MDRRAFLRAAGLTGVAAVTVGCARQEPLAEPLDAPLATPTPTPTPNAQTEAAADASDPALAVEPEAASSAEADPTPSPSEATPDPVPSPEPDPTPESTPSPEPEPEPTASAAAGIVVVERICRDAWGARPAGEGMREHTIQRLTVHHSAVKLGSNTNAPTRIRGHQRYHQDSAKWADIAYHLGVDRNGNVYDLRELRFAGDTFTEYDPGGHFLVLAEGDFNQETPSDAQLEVVARTLAWGALTYGVSTDTISGHRDHAGTTCPGDRMYAALPDVRARAADLVASRGVESTSLCGDAGSRRVADIEAGRA